MSHGRQAWMCHAVGFLWILTLPLGFPVEVLDYVGHVRSLPIQTRLQQGAIQEPTRRTDEWPARQILVVAALLAHEHQVGRGGALPEDRLRGPFPELACTAARSAIFWSCERASNGGGRSAPAPAAVRRPHPRRAVSRRPSAFTLPASGCPGVAAGSGVDPELREGSRRS